MTGYIGNIITIISLLAYCALSSFSAMADSTLKGTISDDIHGLPLEYAGIMLFRDGTAIHGAMADENGKFEISGIKKGPYTITTSYTGYNNYRKFIEISTDTIINIQMSTSENALDEVIITASESRKATSSSIIDETAMRHLQPSSFTDLLELLPGGKSIDPDMSGINSIKLREASNSVEDISSLGVSFVIDGVTQNNDANMQYMPGTLLGSNLSNVSKGVDMRTIPTDNIESVEIIRGIPSVEYGDLTGGTVIINRKKTESPYTARFKADQKSMLFSAGKGFRLDNEGRNILNFDVNYLDAKANPVDNRQNYTRFTTSARYSGHNRYGSRLKMQWNASADYTGSFDDIKHDKDANAAIDAFKSNYNSMAIAGKWTLLFPSSSFIKEIKTGMSFKQEWDYMNEVRSVSIDRPTAIPMSNKEGEADGIYLPYQYIADMTIDGKPLYANANMRTKFSAKHGIFEHRIMAGVDWNLMKNLGDGQIYNPARPLNWSTTVRPRRYKDIPSIQNFSAYAEEDFHIYAGRHHFNITAGLRLQSLLGLDKAYSMNGKVYADPRFNMQWDSPTAGDWKFSLSGGLGWMSKMPTQAQLFPDAKYVDIVELNYYSVAPEDRRVYLMTYKWDNTNYELEPSRNLKWEIRADISYKGNRLSATYFRERMDNAFSSSSYYRILPYKRYDDPTLATFSRDTLIDTYSCVGNDNRVRKEGVEFQFVSKRIELLKTRVTINGAWFKTIYSTASTQYRSQSILIDNKQLSYIGVYNWEDGTEYQSFNTNFMLDTYLQRLGMTFSISAQCTWFTSSRNLWNDGTPVKYVDKSGVTHEFTEKDKNDMYLQHLVENYAGSYFDRMTVPFAMGVNLKATKEIGKYINLALFVNRLLSFTPDYYRGAQLVRRSSTPYFGMEANFRF